MAKRKDGRKNNAGRPTRKTKATVDIILSLLAEGFHVETACQYAKINKQTFYNWIEKDKDFSTQVEFAKSAAVIQLARDVKKQDPWKILKNISSLYKDKVESEISGKDGEEIKIKITDYRGKND